jgi:hypothetical protein
MCSSHIGFLRESRGHSTNGEGCGSSMEYVGSGPTCIHSQVISWLTIARRAVLGRAMYRYGELSTFHLFHRCVDFRGSCNGTSYAPTQCPGFCVRSCMSEHDIRLCITNCLRIQKSGAPNSRCSRADASIGPLHPTQETGLPT